MIVWKSQLVPVCQKICAEMVLYCKVKATKPKRFQNTVTSCHIWLMIWVSQVANSQVVSVLLTSRKSEAKKQKKKIKVNHTSALLDQRLLAFDFLTLFLVIFGFPVIRGVHGKSCSFCCGWSLQSFKNLGRLLYCEDKSPCKRLGSWITMQRRHRHTNARKGNTCKDKQVHSNISNDSWFIICTWSDNTSSSNRIAWCDNMYII